MVELSLTDFFLWIGYSLFYKIACFFFFASRAIFKASNINKWITDCELSLLRDAHIRSWRSKTFSKFVRIVTFHSHANPGKLHPNPSFVVIICRWLLIKLKLLFHCFCVQIFKVWQILEFRFFLIFLDIFNFSHNIYCIILFFRIVILLIFALI